MSKFWMSLAFVPVALGGVAAASVVPANAVAAVECEIHATAVPGGLRLESVVYGMPGSSGAYQLTLARSGAGGSSNVSQGGDFEIDGSGQAVVSVTEFNRSHRDNYNVEMTVEDFSGVSYCHQGTLAR